MFQLDAFKYMKQHIELTTSTESQTTIKYLMGASPMLAAVSAVKEGDLKRHFSPEQKILKLIFAFHRITYCRYDTS